jgi:6-oxocamphor hydrolase
MTSSNTPDFDVYGRKYKHIRMRRERGIIELCLHTDGGILKWGDLVHEELGFCLADVAEDPGNDVVIITGEGDVFCTELDLASFGEINARMWLKTHQEALRILNNLLNIGAPVIGAVNGPAHIHAELLLLSNIVVAAEGATFQDWPHYPAGAVPGDGVHVVWPALLGPTRGSYFLLTGQILDARQALDLGVVNEIVPASNLLPRAWALAEQLMQRPLMVRRYSRALLTQPMKQLMLDHLSHGVALEGLAILDQMVSMDK